MERNGHQRALNQLNKCFFAYFIFGTALTCPLDEAIYDLRESNNFPRTSETLFIYRPVRGVRLLNMFG